MIGDTTEYMPILEYIDGYGIIESCNNDHVIIAYKIFEQNYKLNKDLIYITKNYSPINKDLEQDETLSPTESPSCSYSNKFPQAYE